MPTLEPSSSYTFPYATSPDIIRANQKDAYFTAILTQHLSEILRKLYGQRFTHTYDPEISSGADLLYHGLTTFLGNRTLGEEYCDIVQVEAKTKGLPGVVQRGGYIVSSVLVPYVLGKALPGVRRRARAGLEGSLRRSVRGKGRGQEEGAVGRWSRFVQTYLLENLDTITSPAPVYAVSLAVFYFSGAYYQLGKRIWGLRYIFTRRVPESEQRIGYEVLGVLLVAQLAVQSYVHMQRTLASAQEYHQRMHPHEPTPLPPTDIGHVPVPSSIDVSLDPQMYSSNNALLFGDSLDPTGQTDADRLRLENTIHTPLPVEPRYRLLGDGPMRWIAGKQQRKCTLCLEELKDPSVTTCGHVFCWACIGEWLRERPECPLCRSSVLVQHVLPLRG